MSVFKYNASGRDPVILTTQDSRDTLRIIACPVCGGLVGVDVVVRKDIKAIRFILGAKETAEFGIDHLDVQTFVCPDCSHRGKAIDMVERTLEKVS